VKSWLWIPLLAALAACHEDPPIVIRFEPNDLSGAKAATPPAAPDLATVAKIAAPPDAGAAKQVKKGPAECKVKADCVIEPVDCCDCANGGKQHAIAKAGAAAAKAARAKRCKDAMCTMMVSTDPTCGKRADCQEGMCVLVERKDGEK